MGGSLGPRIQSAFNVVWENTEKLTKWIQVIALVVTAVWVYFRFSEEEASSLETTFVVTAEHQDPFCSMRSVDHAR
jgi:flagellar biogenesis protein FliO